MKQEHYNYKPAPTSMPVKDLVFQMLSICKNSEIRMHLKKIERDGKRLKKTSRNIYRKYKKPVRIRDE